ncbi:phosphoribosylglycinamide formyltransferase [Aquimarina sp. AD10]|uniref:phosphoribosylglycinamide formyltransferase n=1 Tax=Aquimarina sp. AD10 TaxID=1714849 RepID=UPI000E51CA4D|nr:phosphoribosylglycinamide formyltransferase [Aquimarina sp. AD10]AXT61960.1 phosphoribosylglycinamide formyltransferase [Aquimarina sp. AD10]RKN02420.1 phosphoribosylglycinamide formyltransferase [Aquimarina sp. AD10]
MKRIIIFASGSGTNAENIIKYFHERKIAEVTHVFSNNLRAKVLKRAHDLDVQALHFDKESFYDTNEVFNILKDVNPDMIVLAGFLWIFPKKIIEAFPNKVINIHPALLPKYGGKGMYGHHVHEAVIRNKEKESGITIHYVNENYDEGAVIFQAKTAIKSDFCAEDVAKAIHDLEYKHFPVVIEELLFGNEKSDKNTK